MENAATELEGSRELIEPPAEQVPWAVRKEECAGGRGRAAGSLPIHGRTRSA